MFTYITPITSVWLVGGMDSRFTTNSRVSLFAREKILNGCIMLVCIFLNQSRLYNSTGPSKRIIGSRSLGEQNPQTGKLIRFLRFDFVSVYL